MANRLKSTKKSVPMLKKLRHKFIFTNMLFVVIVLVVVVFAVSVVNYNQRVSDIYSALGHSTSMAADGESFSLPGGGQASLSTGGTTAPSSGTTTAPTDTGGSAPSDAGTSAPAAGTDSGEGNHAGGKRVSSGDQFVATSTFTVDSNGNVTAVDNPLSLDSDSVAAAIDAVQQAQQDSGSSSVHGHIVSLNLYYQAVDSSDGTKIAFASGNYVDQNMFSLIGTLGIVSVIACAAFFLMSLFLSRWALGPVDRAWKQQQQFVADASHELKTPLTVIIANDSILMSQPEASVESQMQWIESTDTEAHLMQGLVNDMLDLARPEDAERAVTCGRVDFSDLVESTVLQFESVAFEHGVQLEDSVDSGLFVEGDASRLQRLVSTLVDNACKYVDEKGQISVTLRKEGENCQLRVANTGPAIDPQDLPHLFDRFYRSDKARTRGKGGFGLGLSIAKSVVEDHNGTIEATSNAEQGTAFTVLIPLEG